MSVRDNPEDKRRSQAAWRDKNRGRLREKGRIRRRDLKRQALEKYGLSCCHCGFNDWRALHIDHVDDDGASERKSLGGQNFSGWKFYHWFKKQGWPSGYQTLCANCNLIKHLGEDF